MLRFSCFVFDIKKQVLYKEKNPIPLNVRQAQTLTLFLSNPDKIFSKNDILDQVWGDTVVSEQVVFQNISQIRALIGTDAIKTFPKKGYQWQLPLEEFDADHQLQTPTEVSQAFSEEPGKTKDRNHIKLMALTFLLVLVTVSLFLFHGPENQPSQNENNIAAETIQLIPFAYPYNTDNQQVLVGINEAMSQQFTLWNSSSVSENPVMDFFSSPYIYRESAGLSGQQVLVSGYLHQLSLDDGARQFLLEYLIQGAQRNWHGYIQAADAQLLTEKLQKQLNLLAQSQYFTLTAEAFTSAELSLLHSQSQNNLDILKHLIEAQLRGRHYQVAGAQIDLMLTLSQEQQHPIYEAYAHWLKGQLLLRLEQYELAESELQIASKQMKRAEFLPLQSEISKSLAEVKLPTENFQLIRQYLYQAASEARLAERPVQEIRAYTLLSIRAAKLGYEEEKYDYLARAQKLLDDYGLDASHKMLVYYHYALFAESEAEKEQYYQQVLAQPVTPRNYWVFFSANQFLAELYSQRELWSEAIALADNVDEEARKGFLLAKIYRAKNDVDNTLEQAKASFNSARTQHIAWIGLDMALILLELEEQSSVLGDDSDALLYRRYIHNNHRAWWAKTNKTRLQSVGIELNPYEQQ